MALLSLSEKLAALEDAFPRETGVFRASEIAGPRRDSPLPTGVGRLDALLSGGLPRGRLVEIIGGRSSGRMGIALSALATATRAGENAALIDLGDHFGPHDAQAAGAELDRLLWIRPRRLKDAVLAAEVVLSAGFPLVVADLGVPPLGHRVPDASWMRLARSAEGHSIALLLLTPYPVAGPASDAVVTVRRRHAAWSGTGDSPRLLCGIEARFILEKRRGQRPGQTEEARFRVEEAIVEVAGADLRRLPQGDAARTSVESFPARSSGGFFREEGHSRKQAFTGEKIYAPFERRR
ncbi:MAG: hypothetical protein ACRD16_15630 [Thermoanaerobaculia bacterium]